MSVTLLHKILYDSDMSNMREWLKYSQDFLSVVDEVIKLTPIDRSASPKQKSLRFLFMNARMASYEICLLSGSLLNDESHHFSRAIEYAMRLLWETMIDYFYISEAEDSIAQRYWEFLAVVNTIDSNDRKMKHTAFKQKYANTNHGDYWSGKSREDKTDQGIVKNPMYRNAKSLADLVKPRFEYLNEQVHGNFLFGAYWSFNKHGRNEIEYRQQIGSGLLNLLLFYFVSDEYCKFTGRGSEVKRFRFYISYVLKFFEKTASSEDIQAEVLPG